MADSPEISALKHFWYTRFHMPIAKYALWDQYRVYLDPDYCILQGNAIGRAIDGYCTTTSTIGGTLLTNSIVYVSNTQLTEHMLFIISHECCHGQWFGLSPTQQAAFATEFHRLVTTGENDYINWLIANGTFSTGSSGGNYTTTGDVEPHAMIYGNWMLERNLVAGADAQYPYVHNFPPTLMSFYPDLLVPEVLPSATLRLSSTEVNTQMYINWFEPGNGANLFYNYDGSPAVINGLSITRPHLIQGFLSGFKDVNEQVNLVAGDNPLQIQMLPGSSPSSAPSFEISCNRIGTKIYIDINGIVTLLGTYTGTPISAKNVKGGTHTIYGVYGTDSLMFMFTYEGPGQVPITINMPGVDPIVTTGSLSITSSQVGIEIFVDNNDGNYQDMGPYQGSPVIITQLALGSHHVKGILTGYQDNIQLVAVTAGGTANVSMTMIPNVVPITKGSIKISASQTGTEIWIGGIDEGSYNGTPIIIDNLDPGFYEVKGTKNGYQVSIQNAVVTANATQEVILNMSPTTTYVEDPIVTQWKQDVYAQYQIPVEQQTVLNQIQVYIDPQWFITHPEFNPNAGITYQVVGWEGYPPDNCKLYFKQKMDTGSLAHEFCHPSYFSLTQAQQAAFSTEFYRLRDGRLDNTLNWLIDNYYFSMNGRYSAYGDPLEIHAELYKFTHGFSHQGLVMNNAMPPTLVQYYPYMLFAGATLPTPVLNSGASVTMSIIPKTTPVPPVIKPSTTPLIIGGAALVGIALIGMMSSNKGGKK